MTQIDDEARLIAALTHLRAPFERKQISKLPATQKRPELDYVGHPYVTDRLNMYAPGWTYVIDRIIEVEGQDGWPHVQAIIGTMTVCGISRVEVGAVDGPSSFGQEMKEAISDFIRRGGMRFGVALELWAKGELAEAPASPPAVAAASDAGRTTEDGSGVRKSAGGADPDPSEVVEGEFAGIVTDETLAELKKHFGTNAKALMRARMQWEVNSIANLSERQAQQLLQAKVGA